MLTNEVLEYVEIACVVCDAPALAGRISVSWNPRFTARMGDPRLGRGFIRPSAPLRSKASPDEQVETVVHEACHVLADSRSLRRLDSTRGRNNLTRAFSEQSV